MRILVVEDDAILNDGLLTGLNLAGFSVEGASTLDEARAALTAGSFSAVVLDIMLPDGSGIDLLRHGFRSNFRARCGRGRLSGQTLRS